MLTNGIKGTGECTVTQDNTAKTMGSGELDVFATPAMIALMEKTAYLSVADALEEGMGTVGTRIDVRHLAASPIGMKIVCDSELVETDNRRLVFHVEAYDESGKIGEGTHERFIVENEKFQRKADEKRMSAHSSSEKC